MFMKLDDGEKECIVGGIPDRTCNFVDASCIGMVLEHLANRDSKLAPFLNESAPNFCEKIAFNGLTEPVSTQLRFYHYQAAIVNDFLEKRDSGLKQSVAEEISNLYTESKLTIPSIESGAANLRYVWMVEKLIPNTMKQNIHSMKAYRDAAQVVLSKYFETCDVYEHPECTNTA